MSAASAGASWLPQAAFYTFKKVLNYFYDVAAGKAQWDRVYFSLLLQLQKSCGRHFTSHLNKCFITLCVGDSHFYHFTYQSQTDLQHHVVAPFQHPCVYSSVLLAEQLLLILQFDFGKKNGGKKVACGNVSNIPECLWTYGTECTKMFLQSRQLWAEHCCVTWAFAENLLMRAHLILGLGVSTLLLYISFQQHLTQSLETRLNALEESSSLAQKQLGVALTTAEQLRSSDLPAQVLSLHTEMKSRLAEMQRATVSLEQLSQLQATLKGKSEEFEGVKSQVDDLAALSSEMSRKVEGLTGSLREAESRLEDGSGHVAALSSTLDAQGALVLSLKEQVETCQGQLEARTHGVATVR